MESSGHCPDFRAYAAARFRFRFIIQKLPRTGGKQFLYDSNPHPRHLSLLVAQRLFAPVPPPVTVIFFAPLTDARNFLWPAPAVAIDWPGVPALLTGRFARLLAAQSGAVFLVKGRFGIRDEPLFAATASPLTMIFWHGGRHSTKSAPPGSSLTRHQNCRQQTGTHAGSDFYFSFRSRLPLRRTAHSPRAGANKSAERWLTKWLTNQVETGSSNSDTIRLNTQWNRA